VKEIIQKDELIANINRKIERDLRIPIRPSSFDLTEQNNSAWDEYFRESDWQIQKKKEQDAIGRQLEDLEKAKDGIKSKIAPLIPSCFHGIRIVVINNRGITVNDENVIIH